MSRHPGRALLASLVILFTAGKSLRAVEPELVNIRAVDPTIVVELRYATERNLARRALYPANMPALVRPHVAAQLLQAQTFLQMRGFRLKIWDAYRPKSAHEQLWQFSPNTDYVADPATGGSLHTHGVAVDATMVDQKGREVAMPTDFDDFTPAAWLRNAGRDQTIQRNLRMLQSAMARAGFYGMRTEWWHFVSKDWQKYQAVPEVSFVLRATPVQPLPTPPLPSPPRAPATASPSRARTR